MSPLYETATFEYLKWQDKYLKEKPYQILSGLDPGETSISNSNLIFETGPLERVRDVRGEEGNYCLDEHGFAFRKVDSTFWNFDDREKVERDFIPNVVEPFILENVGGANRIVVFDWHLRKNSSTDFGGYQDLNNGTHALKPVKTAHVDQTPAAALRRVRFHLKEESDTFLEGRVRLINFWKPLYHPVEDAPLAVCDGGTVQSEDLVSCDLIKRTYIGETAWALPSPAYKWHFLRNQGPDEALVFKIFDSDTACRARCCPHASFTPLALSPHARTRESIEVRVLVLGPA